MWNDLRTADRHPFPLVEREAATALTRACLRSNLANNEVVYRQDEEAESLNSIVSGCVRLSDLMEDGSSALRSTVPPSDSFGELATFEGGTHPEMATAVGPLTVDSIPITAS